MKIEDFPTRIHPFDFYALLQEDTSITDVIVITSEEVSLPVDAPIPYVDKQPVITVKGRKFVETTTVPVITEGGRKLF